MKCPACKTGRTEVEATRWGDTRTRRCLACGHRFLTLETVVKALPRAGDVRKKGGPDAR